MKKIILFISIGLSALYGGLYDYEYNVNEKTTKPSPKLSNFLMYGDFERIIRFEPLIIDKDSGKLKSGFLQELYDISKVIKKYKNNDEVVITIIGYRKHIETHNEEIIRKSSLSYKRILPNSMVEESKEDNSLDYAKSIRDTLVDMGVKKEKLVVEHRRGDEKLFTEGTQKGKDLNYRVMVSIYIPEKKIKKQIEKVNKDTLVVSESNNTVTNSKLSMPLLPELIIYYANDSAKITKDQIEKIKKFAKFLKENKNYNAKLIGFTSSASTSAYNNKLSLRRSRGVVDMLVKFGVERKRLLATGKGENGLWFNKQHQEDPAKSRRVEAKLYLNK